MINGKNSIDVAMNVWNTTNQAGHTDGNGKNSLIGNGETWVSAPSLETLKEREMQATHNSMVEEEKAKWDSKIDEELKRAEEIVDKMDTMEIMPINSYVLCKPYSKNPFQKITVSEKSGLIIGLQERQFKNQDTGEIQLEDNLSVQAHVIEVSPMCKFVKEGDDIFFRRSSGVPVPFFGQGFEVVAESSIQVVINEGLKKRFEQMRG